MNNIENAIPGFEASFSTDALDCGVECHVVNFDADTVVIEVYWSGGTTHDNVVEVRSGEYFSRSFLKGRKIVVRSDSSDGKLFNYRFAFINKSIADATTRLFKGTINGGSELKSVVTTSCGKSMDVQVQNLRRTNLESEYRVSCKEGEYSLSVAYSDQ